MATNPHRKRLELEQRWIDRCQSYAIALVAHYKAGGSPNSLAVSGGRGTEYNVERQTLGKIGEVACAIFFGLDPEIAVKWELKPDRGSDVILPNEMRVDVKTTVPHYKLIWSRTVNHLYESKEFDLLIAVSVDSVDRRICWIEGYMPKAMFLKRKHIADGKNSGLEIGTWFMDKHELLDIEPLRVFAA